MNELDLTTATRLFVPDFRTNFLPTLHDHHVAKFRKDAIVQRLEDGISEFQAAPVRDVWIPKPALRVRLGALPELEDWIVYNATVMAIAPEVEPQLIPAEEEVLFSFRWNANDVEGMFRSIHMPYVDFEKRSLELLEEFPFVMVTDMVDYFDHLDLMILRSTLLRMGAHKELVVFLLERLLKRWRHPSGRGIPQGPWASSYLANLYLDPIDKMLIQRGFTHTRYSDDVRVFCKSVNEGRKAVLTLAEGCRELGLSLQSEKTRFMTREQASRAWEGLESRLEELGEEVAERLKDYFITTGPYGEETVEEIPAEEEQVFEETLHDMFDSITNGLPPHQVDRRSFRFVLNRLRGQRDKHALAYCLETLVHLPDQASVVARYLERFIDDMTVQERVAQFLGSTDNLYDWQATHLLSVHCGAEKVRREVLEYAWNVATDLNAHFALRSAGVDVVAAHGTEDQVRELVRRFSRELSEDVRFAVVLASRRLHEAERNRFLASCRGLSPVMDDAVAMAKAT
jgi:hypothetical protein